MNIEEILLNTTRFNLIKDASTPKDIKKIDNQLIKLTSCFNKNSQKLLVLFDKIDNHKININNYPNYTIGDRTEVIIKNNSQLQEALVEVYDEKIIGFDTEQKPTFKKGQIQHKISIVQISTKNYSFIIQMKYFENNYDIGKVLSDKSILKVGFGLNNDTKQLTKLFGKKPESLLDISVFIKKVFKTKNNIGTKNAIAIFLEKKLQKSKNAALSNWENSELTLGQIKYASEDGTAPLDVYYSILTEFSFLHYYAII
ncbi:MAG: 3'-5' exonuclease domain-containing protein 2 [Spirochaetaceae bacterium]